MLFPEDNFKDTALNGMALKSLVRDYSIEADELMDWLEKGCFDALEKQYVSDDGQLLPPPTIDLYNTAANHDIRNIFG